MKPVFFVFLISFCLTACFGQSIAGHTEITKWQYGKNGAVSITFDDGSYHQFTKALPIMERLKLPATFFIVTGGIPGSKYHGKFIGRSVKEIIDETASVSTSDQNFLERCSAGGYLGYKGTITYVTRAASLYDSKRNMQAFKLIDELYKRVRNGEFATGYQPCDEVLAEKGSTWEDFRRYAAQGYEFASHSITHASMPGLDSVNIVYELEKSKEEMRTQMGEQYTFSTEVPYGYENERVMQIAYKIYPALRNRMPEPWLKEIDRPSRKTPGTTDKAYIQWQREANTRTPLGLMKSWVDTAAAKNNTWLVLVFHGVDSLGYEALPSPLLDKYFQYIKNADDKVWIATFGDVTKYMRERQGAKIKITKSDGRIIVALNHLLDRRKYNLPLTLKTYVPAEWTNASMVQGNISGRLAVAKDNRGSYLLYQAQPNGPKVVITTGEE